MAAGRAFPFIVDPAAITRGASLQHFTPEEATVRIGEVTLIGADQCRVAAMRQQNAMPNTAADTTTHRTDAASTNAAVDIQRNSARTATDNHPPQDRPSKSLISHLK